MQVNLWFWLGVACYLAGAALASLGISRWVTDTLSARK